MFANARRQKIKNFVLGETYDLSFAFVDSKKSQALNKLYRHKNKPANVLSFPLAKTAGEILIDQETVTKEAEALFLFIHGLLHLKGYAHGSRMEAKEDELADLFFTPNEKHHYRHRYRKLRD